MPIPIFSKGDFQVFILFLGICSLSHAQSFSPFAKGDPDEIIDSIGQESRIESYRKKKRVANPTRENFGTGIVLSNVGSSHGIFKGIAFQTNGAIITAGRCFTDSDPNVCLVRYKRSGVFDTSFNSTGFVNTTFGFYDDWIHDLQLQTNGQAIVAGRAHNGTNLNFSILRYNSNGTLDTSFATVGGAKISIGSGNAFGRALKIDSSGRMIVAGYFEDGANYNSAVIRLNSEGSLDTSFNTTGRLLFSFSTGTSSLSGVDIQTDGKIIVSGGEHSGTWDIAVARLTSDGQLDTTFSTLGYLVSSVSTGADFLFRLQQDTTGRIYAVGVYGDGTGLTYGGVFRFRSNGTFDGSFNGSGYSCLCPSALNSRANNLFLETSGKVVVVGYNSVDGTPSDNNFMIFRYSSNGTPDNAWNGGGYTLNTAGPDANELYGISRYGQSEYVAVGGTYDTNWGLALVRYSSDGALGQAGKPDFAFGTNGSKVHGFGNAYTLGITKDLKGRLLVSGSNWPNSGIYRLDSTGSFDTSFNTRGYMSFGITFWSPRCPAANSKDQIYLVMQANGVNSVTRIQSNGTLDVSFSTVSIPNPSPTAYDYCWSRPQFDPEERYLFNYGTGFSASVYRMRTNGSFDTSFNTIGYVEAGYEFSIDSQGKIQSVGTGYMGPDSTYQATKIYRLNSNGAYDTAFATAGYSVAQGPIFYEPGSNYHQTAFQQVALPDGSHVISRAGRVNSDDPFRTYLFRVLSNGDFDSSFNTVGYLVFAGPHYGSAPRRMIYVENSDQIYVDVLQVGDDGGTLATGVFRLSTTGKLDTSFGSDGFFYSGNGIEDIAEGSNGTILQTGTAGYLYGVLP